jgi:hypothetical protein
MTLDITAKSLNLTFPGANEALRLLGQLYLKLHIESISKSATYNSTTTQQTSRSSKQKANKAIPAGPPVDYRALAKTAYTIAAIDLEDAHAYTYLLPLLDAADPSRGPLLLRAAASGNEVAWKELAGVKAILDIDQDSLEKPASESVDAVVEEEASKLLGDPELWRQEWEALQIHWEALSKAPDPAS